MDDDHRPEAGARHVRGRLVRAQQDRVARVQSKLLCDRLHGRGLHERDPGTLARQERLGVPQEQARVDWRLRDSLGERGDELLHTRRLDDDHQADICERLRRARTLESLRDLRRGERVRVGRVDVPAEPELERRGVVGANLRRGVGGQETSDEDASDRYALGQRLSGGRSS